MKSRRPPVIIGVMMLVTIRNVFLCCTVAVVGLSDWAVAEPAHGIAMIGDPALPADFSNLPYVNPAAPKGGQIT